MKKSSTRGRNITFALVALAVSFGLGGCSALESIIGGDDPVRDEDTQEIVGEGQANVFKIGVGDCLNETSEESLITDVPVVPCSDPHDEEIYFEFELQEPNPDNPNDIPGDAAMLESARAKCEPEFETFTGIAWEESETLDWYPLLPSIGSWVDAKDRLVQCVIYDTAGQTSGTLKDVTK